MTDNTLSQLRESTAELPLTLNAFGFLPLGVHNSSLKGLEDAFGRFKTSDRRPKLFAKLKEYLTELQKLDLIDHVIVDGSFVTSKADPEDIDLIVVLKEGEEPTESWNFHTTSLTSSKWVKRNYGFDVKVGKYESTAVSDYLEIFSKVKDDSTQSKGVVRVRI